MTAVDIHKISHHRTIHSTRMVDTVDIADIVDVVDSADRNMDHMMAVGNPDTFHIEMVAHIGSDIGIVRRCRERHVESSSTLVVVVAVVGVGMLESMTILVPNHSEVVKISCFVVAVEPFVASVASVE